MIKLTDITSKSFRQQALYCHCLAEINLVLDVRRVELTLAFEYRVATPREGVSLARESSVLCGDGT